MVMAARPSTRSLRQLRIPRVTCRTVIDRCIPCCRANDGRARSVSDNLSYWEFRRMNKEASKRDTQGVAIVSYV
jgi:hypothetical protein